MQCAGNLYDAISLAVKSALHNMKIPRVHSALLDGGDVDLVLSDDPADCDRLKVESYPLLVTICKIGEHVIVDPTIEEETCSTTSVVIGVSFPPDQEQGFITAIKTIGSGSIHSDTLDDCIDLGLGASKALNRKLMESLEQDERESKSKKYKNCGFLN